MGGGAYPTTYLGGMGTYIGLGVGVHAGGGGGYMAAVGGPC